MLAVLAGRLPATAGLPLAGFNTCLPGLLAVDVLVALPWLLLLGVALTSVRLAATGTGFSVSLVAGRVLVLAGFAEDEAAFLTGFTSVCSLTSGSGLACLRGDGVFSAT